MESLRGRILRIERLWLRLLVDDDSVTTRRTLYDDCYNCAKEMQIPENQKEKSWATRHILRKELELLEAKLILSPKSTRLLDRIIRLCARLEFKKSAEFYKEIRHKLVGSL